MVLVKRICFHFDYLCEMLLNCTFYIHKLIMYWHTFTSLLRAYYCLYVQNYPQYPFLIFFQSREMKWILCIDLSAFLTVPWGAVNSLHRPFCISFSPVRCGEFSASIFLHCLQSREMRWILCIESVSIYSIYAYTFDALY